MLKKKKNTQMKGDFIVIFQSESLLIHIFLYNI